MKKLALVSLLAMSLGSYAIGPLTEISGAPAAVLTTGATSSAINAAGSAASSGASGASSLGTSAYSSTPSGLSSTSSTGSSFAPSSGASGASNVSGAGVSTGVGMVSNFVGAVSGLANRLLGGPKIKPQPIEKPKEEKEYIIADYDLIDNFDIHETYDDLFF